MKKIMDIYEGYKSTDEITDVINDLSYSVDEIDGVINLLKRTDKEILKYAIQELELAKIDLEEELEGLDEEWQDANKREQKEQENERIAMNIEFERSRL